MMGAQEESSALGGHGGQPRSYAHLPLRLAQKYARILPVSRQLAQTHERRLPLPSQLKKKDQARPQRQVSANCFGICKSTPALQFKRQLRSQ